MPPVQSRATSKLTSLLRDRVRLADLVAILGVPAILVGVFFLPMPVRRSLAFNTNNPTVVTAFTSHYVHFSLGHLLGNLVGYSIIVPLTYLLSVLVKRRWQFRVVFVSLLLGMPFALSLVNWLVLGPGLAIGFSGILLGFYGYLPLVLYQYASTYAQGEASIRQAPFIFFFGIVSIAAVLATQVLFSAFVAFCSLLIAIVYISVISEQVTIRGTGTLKRVGFSEIGLVSALLYVLYPLAAFPSNLLFGTRILNLLAHFLGYSLTFISTYITIIVTRWSGFIESFSTESEN